MCMCARAQWKQVCAMVCACSIRERLSYMFTRTVEACACHDVHVASKGDVQKLVLSVCYGSWG